MSTFPLLFKFIILRSSIIEYDLEVYLLFEVFILLTMDMFNIEYIKLFYSWMLLIVALNFISILHSQKSVTPKILVTILLVVILLILKNFKVGLTSLCPYHLVVFHFQQLYSLIKQRQYWSKYTNFSGFLLPQQINLVIPLFLIFLILIEKEFSHLLPFFVKYYCLSILVQISVIYIKYKGGVAITLRKIRWKIIQIQSALRNRLKQNVEQVGSICWRYIKIRINQQDEKQADLRVIIGSCNHQFHPQCIQKLKSIQMYGIKAKRCPRDQLQLLTL